jgi:hypothetical protein
MSMMRANVRNARNAGHDIEAGEAEIAFDQGKDGFLDCLELALDLLEPRRIVTFEQS